MYSTEQQKLVSSLIAKLRLAYPYYFKDLDEDMILGLVGMFNDSLCYYSPQCLNAAINSIIKESKFMPTIAEIIEKCDSCIGHFTHSVLEKMKKVPLLLIDDIGAENTTAWSRDDVLMPLLQYRMDHKLATFFTSNLNYEELEEHFSISKNKVDIVKARRIMERIRYLTDEIELVSDNLRN